MSNHLGVLRGYAQKRDPSKLPPSVLFSYNDATLTLFDLYPKAMFHFLILPRLGSKIGICSDSESSDSRQLAPLTMFDLANLRSLLKHDKTRAKRVLEALEAESLELKARMEEEMISRYGFKWGIWTGFHAIPSMDHLHLHVISNDLCSPSLKHKKHYLSFNPKGGFFLHLKDVLEWFDAEPSYYNTMSELKRSQYEPLLKGSISCWRCGSEMRNMPTLKEHLQKEWDHEEQKEKGKLRAKN